MIRAILHADRKWGIGKNNSLMFSLPADMKFFRETTTGHTVVMGGNTLRSFPGGRPLKNRVNVVLTHAETQPGSIAFSSANQPIVSAQGGQGRAECVFVRDAEQLKEEIARREKRGEEIFVIGGTSVYALLLPYCGEILVTKVDADGGADAFFPDLDRDPRFSVAAESSPTEDNGYTIRFVVYKNNAVKPL